MTARIWIEIHYSAPYRTGGWAFVREGAERGGAAGGLRGASAERAALAGLAEAVKAAPAGPVTVYATDASITGRIAAVLLGDPEAEPPTEDLDLWARLQTELKTRKLNFGRIAPASDSPQAFAAAWAQFAFEKTRASGAFISPIPKPNLAKVKGL